MNLSSGGRYGFNTYSDCNYFAPVGSFSSGGDWRGLLAKHSADSVRLHPWNSARGLDYCQALKLMLSHLSPLTRPKLACY